ncbi:MAG: IS4 family transposase [Bacteroidota bacterium]
MSKDTNLAGQPVICQLMSFIPKELVNQSVTQYQSDKGYTEMLTYRQLVFIMYGVISRCHSLSNLCKSLLFLENKLSYLDIRDLPAKSTLSDANKNRNSDVFGRLYQLLYTHYQSYLSQDYIEMFINEEIHPDRVEIFDSSTVSLFVDVFKVAGRTPINGQKKGGLKLHTKLPLSSVVPDLVVLSEASQNDKNFISDSQAGQLEVKPGQIYIFDKGYVNYEVWDKWSKSGVFYLTRLNENASYEILTGQQYDIVQYADGGIISDQIIQLGPAKARLVTYVDPETSNVLKFVTNLFDCRADTICMLYQCRWSIEVLFKSIKQNFELAHFYAESPEGIKTQIWIVLIANLIFRVIHRQTKEYEMFTTIVAMASKNMGSFVSFIKLISLRYRERQNRDIEKIQLELFDYNKGGVSTNRNKSP